MGIVVKRGSELALYLYSRGSPGLPVNVVEISRRDITSARCYPRSALDNEGTSNTLVVGRLLYFCSLEPLAL